MQRLRRGHPLPARDVLPMPIRGSRLDQVNRLGTVYSFTIIRQVAHQGFEPEVPYVYAIIDLDDGARMISNVVNIDPTQVEVGMRVQVTFDDVTPEISIPKFEPVS